MPRPIVVVSRVCSVRVRISRLDEVCEERDEMAAGLLVAPRLEPRSPGVLREEEEDLI